MVEEVRGSISGPNGERLNLHIGGHSVGVATKDLIPILLIAAACIGGYLLYTGIDRRIHTLLAQHDHVLTLIHEQTAILLKGQGEQRAFILEQMRLRDEQQDEQTELIRQYIIRHEHNQDLPREQRVPIELPPPAEKR